MRWLLIPLMLGVLLPGGAAAVESRPEQARAGMIEAHNAVRDRVHPDLPELSWWEQAAAQAQDWADMLARNGCRMRHNPDLQDHGQNLYGQNLFWAGPRREVTVTRSGPAGEIVDRNVRTSVQAVTAEDVVERWASEKQWYDYEANRCRAPEGEICGHYTQIVWADTAKVGCGMSVCEDKGQIWACDYDPAGNIVGQRPY